MLYHSFLVIVYRIRKQILLKGELVIPFFSYKGFYHFFYDFMVFFEQISIFESNKVLMIKTNLEQMNHLDLIKQQFLNLY